MTQADARDTWLPLMRTIAFESRAYVLSANQCVKRKHLPEWIKSPSSLNSPQARKDDAKADAAAPITGSGPEHQGSAHLEPAATANSVTDGEEFVCRGGSCIIGPDGTVLAGPLWEQEDGVLSVEVDFEDCEKGRLDLDVAGSYGRGDAFRLEVEGLDINPPP